MSRGGGVRRGYEKTRRSGVTGVPEAHEFTFASSISPLYASGTGLVGQQTSERPLYAFACCRATRTLRDSLSPIISPDSCYL